MYLCFVDKLLWICSHVSPFVAVKAAALARPRCLLRKEIEYRTHAYTHTAYWCNSGNKSINNTAFFQDSELISYSVVLCLAAGMMVSFFHPLPILQRIQDDLFSLFLQSTSHTSPQKLSDERCFIFQTNMIPGSPSSDDSNSGGFNKLRRRKLSFRRRTEKGNPSSPGLISQRVSPLLCWMFTLCYSVHASLGHHYY